MPANRSAKPNESHRCNPACRTPLPSERPSTLYELMFASRQNLSRRLTDAADLLIDFATLGEYGLEPVGRTRQGCADASASARRAPKRAAVRREAQCNLLQEAGFRGSRRQLAR